MSIDWENAPEGAEYYLYGLFYKIKRGVVWYFETTEDAFCASGHSSEDAFLSITGVKKRPSSETSTSNGLTADYYELPANATQLQDLISFKDMNAQVGESFRSLYRYGQSSHSDKLRDAKKVVFYMNAEIERLEKYG